MEETQKIVFRTRTTSRRRPDHKEKRLEKKPMNTLGMLKKTKTVTALC